MEPRVVLIACIRAKSNARANLFQMANLAGEEFRTTAHSSFALFTSCKSFTDVLRPRSYRVCTLKSSDEGAAIKFDQSVG